MSDGRLPVRRRWIGWTIAAVTTLLLFAVGWVVVRGVAAASELQNVKSSSSQLRSAIADGDIERAERIAPRIAGHTGQARDLTSDVVWRGFEFIPWLGANFTAMREIAEIADDVASDAVIPVLDVARSIDLGGLGLSGSRIDLTPFAAVQVPLADADEVLSAADTRALQIDADAALPPLADAVREMRDVVTEAATIVGALHGASVLLPPMLGADGPRTYVVAMQNNAELRSEGGIIGSLALIRADGGHISVVRQASTADLPRLDEPLAVTDSSAALFGEGPGRHIQNVTSIPDFTEAAPLIAQRWEQQFSQPVDGVVAVDTVVAAHLLGPAGAVTFGPFTADADTIVPILLSEVYATVSDPIEQDAVFAQAANALFSVALSGNDPKQLISSLAAAAGENRIRIWSAHEDEQGRLAASTLGGALPTDGARGPHVGVLLNDITGGKMDFYADADINTAVGVCHGTPTTQVRVTWKSDAPLDAEQTLSTHVTGGSGGDIRTLIAIYGPEGATIESVDGGTSDEGVQTALLGTRSVVQHELLLSPGDSASIAVTFVGEGAGDHRTHLQHTPMIEAPDTTRTELTCD
ncbi:DUF4012 domain-containing protein [Microbacterium aerolatum]|uniref:DUF4012 domain-containing protein n=1 Tax=Microbacterium aerolatum TaxID=153731 RepID=A0A511A9Q5_9MICO|nr:DUF4012 domain-containing protein [Microbacterium aerolatum]GEK84928.1 hypothetical protein MAE01_01040 [Microbacterium aerolatum]GGB37275.1 hypothetical protein GCM10007198_29850 [Microbacterium aerolatum]